MLNSNFANAVLKAMFGQGELYSRSTISSQSYSTVTGGLGTTCYIGLLNGSTEYTDDNYERQLLGDWAKSAKNMSEPAANEIHNTEFIKFNPIADGKSGVGFDGFGLYAAKTGGTAVYTAKLKDALTGLAAGDMPVFHRNALSVTFGKDDTANAAAMASLSAE